MARKELFSKYFLDPIYAKAKIMIAPDGGDGGGGGGGGSATPAPIVTSVTASKTQITKNNETVQFTVNIYNEYTSCLINGSGISAPGLSVVNGVPSSPVTPTATGTLTYTVTAVNSAIAAPNTGTKTTTISVLAWPTIGSFTATVSGSNVLLVPTFSPTTGITAKIIYGTTTINNVVSGTTYTVAKPSVSTTYTLEVANEAGVGNQLSQTVPVTALNPTISGFASSTQTVNENTNFTITPAFTNGTGVITRSKGTFTGGATSIACSTGVAITTQSTETTTFTLRVTAT